jgi:polyhydroxybutyrate depolymerase
VEEINSLQFNDMRINILSFLLLIGMASFAQTTAGVTDSTGKGGNYFTRRVEKEKKIVADSIRIEGYWRDFHFRKPNEKSKGFSLVFVMHGSGGSGPAMMKRVPEFDGISDQEKMIVVFPSGYKNFWNECRKKSTAEANAIDINEQAFFQGMINYFVKKYGIDREKVFAVGTSGGGHMAFKLGMTMPSAFKAITAIVANLPDTNNLDCTPAGIPMNVMIVNGTEDKTNPYNGGEVILGSGNFGFVRSSERTLQYWADLAGYAGAPAKKLLPDLDPKDGKRIETYRYSGGKKEVVLLKVIGGKHDYPGDINVHRYAWEFFKSVQ